MKRLTSIAHTATAWAGTLAAVLVLAVCVVLPTTATAGPWVKEPGKTYVKVSGGMFQSDEAFDLSGNLEQSPYSYSHTSVRTYAEIGLLPRVALNFSVPFLASTNELNERTRYKRWGPGDLDLSAQVSLLESDACAVSLAPGVRVPLYEGTVGAGDTVNAIGPGAAGLQRYTPALGDGSVDLSAMAAAGCSLYPVPAWVTAQAGPRIRLQGFGDSIDYAVDGGIFVWPERLALTARVAGVQRFSSNNERPTKRYTSVGGGLLLNVYRGFALEASASYIPVGAFVARGWSASAGLSFTGEIFSNPYD
jgi:hypothetical protein